MIKKTDKRPNPLLHGKLERFVAGYRELYGGTSSTAVKNIIKRVVERRHFNKAEISKVLNAATKKGEGTDNE